MEFLFGDVEDEFDDWWNMKRAVENVKKLGGKDKKMKPAAYK